MRKNWIIAACAALGLCLIPATASADSSCSSGHVCVWTELGWNGAKGETKCSESGLHKFAGIKHSGKNECANRAVWFRKANGEKVFCAEPGQWFAQFNEVEQVWVGEEGARC